MNTAYPVHPHAGEPRAEAPATPNSHPACVAAGRSGSAKTPARCSATPNRAAEIAALFALAALAVSRASAAPLPEAILIDKPIPSTWGMLYEEPALTQLPMPVPSARASEFVWQPSHSIIVRQSTRATQPSLRIATIPERKRTPIAFGSKTRATVVASRPKARKTVGATARVISERQRSYVDLAPLRLSPGHSPFIAQPDGTIQIYRSAKVTDLALPELPAATVEPAKMPATQPVAANVDNTLPPEVVTAKLQPMGKVISVSSLKLPPASEPLPKWSADKIVRVDASGERLAQNPIAPALRQPSAPITNSDRLPNQLEVSVGTFVVLLATSDLNTVAVADPNTADVAVVNSRAVLVNGKTPGVTSLVIVDRTRIRQYQVRVTPAIGTRPPDVASAIGLPGVSVRPLRDALVLEGEVENAEEARRAVEIAGIFSPKVINQLSVRGAPTDSAAISTQIQSAINLPGVTVRTIGDTTLLEGKVENATQMQRAQTIASHLSKNVLNLIELPVLTVDQVRATFGGVDTTAPGGAPGTGTSGTGMPGSEAPGISVRQIGDQIILEGEASSQAMADQMVATAARSGLQVINRLQVSTTSATMASEIGFRRQVEAAIGMPGVRATGNQRLLVLQGTVPDSNAAMVAEHIAAAYAPDIQNLLYTPHPILVNVDVSIVEINRNDAKNLGVQYGSVQLLTEAVAVDATGARTVNRTINTALQAGQFTGGNGFLGTGEVSNIDPFRARLNALYTTGNARLLSNPNTTLLSGRQASFQVGGQVPIPSGNTTNAAGTSTTIVFKDYGVLVDVMPTASADGVVTMRVRTEVSQPDLSNGVVPPGGGGVIPGFSRRSTVSEVTVPPNGTIALSGLIQDNIIKSINRFPILSDLPILGKLFQSRNFQHNKTELVIFIKPTVLPNPLKEGQLAPVSVVASVDNPGAADYGVGATLATAKSIGNVAGNTGGAASGGGSAPGGNSGGSAP